MSRPNSKSNETWMDHFERVEGLKHWDSGTKNNIFSCNYCGYNFDTNANTTDDLMHHIKSKHDITESKASEIEYNQFGWDNWKCNYCGVFGKLADGAVKHYDETGHPNILPTGESKASLKAMKASGAGDMIDDIPDGMDLDEWLNESKASEVGTWTDIERDEGQSMSLLARNVWIQDHFNELSSEDFTRLADDASNNIEPDWTQTATVYGAPESKASELLEIPAELQDLIQNSRSDPDLEELRKAIKTYYEKLNNSEGTWGGYRERQSYMNELEDHINQLIKNAKGKRNQNNWNLYESKASESVTIDDFKRIKDNLLAEKLNFEQGSALVDIQTANAIVAVWDNINEEQRLKFPLHLTSADNVARLAGIAFKSNESKASESFVEDDHQRDEGGQFTSGGSGWKTK